MADIHNLPLAANGLTSYRYAGRYGWIMIGAVSVDEALHQAQISTVDTVTIDRLEIWHVDHYQKVTP